MTGSASALVAGADGSAAAVQVDDGVVTLRRRDRPAQRGGARAEWLTEAVSDVIAVRNRLKYLQDDGTAAQPH